GVLVPGAAADPLIAAGAEGPAAVLGGRAVAGDQHAADVAGHARVVQGAVQLVDGVRAEGVPDVRAVERDAHGAFPGAVLDAAVIRDVGEVEARHGLPQSRIEQLRDTGILHTWDNRRSRRSARGPPRSRPALART